MRKIYKKILLGFILCHFYMPAAYAVENDWDTKLASFLKSAFVMSLSAGPSWESAGEAQTLNLAPDVIK